MAEEKKTARTPTKAKTTGKKNDNKTGAKAKPKRKATSKSKNVGGRPRINIDKKEFENLCSIQCTKEEIASVFTCSEDTIERWCKREYGESFAVSYKKYAAGGKTSLRRSQFRLAETSASMAIWLGKQYLGQKDNASEDMSGETNEVEIYMPKKDGDP